MTGSGINVRRIIFRLLLEREDAGFTEGPGISNYYGILYTTNEIDKILQEILEECYDEDPLLFPPDIKSSSDILESYHCFRSLRKASDIQALEMRVSQADINCVNPWGQDQRNTHELKLKFPMRQHYSQPELLIQPFLRYTMAM